MNRYSLLFILAILCQNSIFAQSDTVLTFVVSGDSHGMVQACDCPHDPGGGLPKRSTLIKGIGHRENLLLLDAGGFSAGGLYDSYTEGRKADSIKTIQMIKGMSVIGYNAVAVGDDDLQYGAQWLLQQAKTASLPLISANCFKADGSALFPAYLFVKIGTKTVAITALTSSEKLFPIDKNIIIRDPIVSLKKVWKEIVSKSDYQIILSHLGMPKSSELVDSFPECDLVVNGHRKNETNALSFTGNTPVMEFGFQGKSLSFVTLDTKGKKFNIVKSGWYPVTSEIPEDSTVISAINTVTTAPNTSHVYDLYIMSQCPYGLEALNGFVRFVKDFPSVDWNIWFIGTAENDTILSSLHGPEEVRDEMFWLAIKELYPAKWFEFLKQRTEKSVPTELIIKSMGLSIDDIQKWISINGVAQLSGQYLRSARLNIKASPTLLINNIPYEKPITGERLAKNQCVSSGVKSILCDSLPQCFDDTDCKKKGKIGRCVSGKCVFSDAVPFNFTIITADSTHQHPENTVAETTEDLFPGATVQKLSMSSSEGAQYIRTYTPEALPFYLFGKEVKQAYNFDQIESGLIDRNNGLTFKKGVIRNNYFYKRNLEKGKIILFVDPFFKEISGILSSIAKDTTLQKKITIVPVIYTDPQNDSWGTEEGFRQEEALRWLVLGKFFKDKQNAYLREYAKTPGNSYWFKIPEKAGFSSDTLIAKLRANSDMLFEHWKLLLSLSIREPIAVLFDNREVAIAGNKRELEGLLQIK